MDDRIIHNRVQVLRQAAASLLVYRSVLAGKVGVAFLNLLSALLQEDAIVALQAYGAWFETLANANQSWSDYLVTQMLWSDNAFTRQVQHTELVDLPPSLVEATRRDFQILQMLYGVTGQQLRAWLETKFSGINGLVLWQGSALPTHLPLQAVDLLNKFAHLVDWREGLGAIAYYHQHYGSGIFARYRTLRWQGGELIGIDYPDPIRLNNLTAYDLPRQNLIRNTEALLNGYPALNVLLYGSRGSGKSSLVKALVNEYGDRGLRLIEVAKADLQDLPQIVELVRASSQKFILFVDDLSFEEDDNAFKALKVVLEGSLTARPANVVVYATSNRRHLIREFFDDRPSPRDSNEVHAWDTVQEKLSFSDRFGLILTFEPANQETYLDIVRHLARQAGVALATEDLDSWALQWAIQHNGRSGRTARQFVDYLRADLLLK